MCVLVLRFAPGADWPLAVAANRDEMVARPFDPPAAHWPALPDAVGGRDAAAGGTWLAVNGAGVVAGVLNRPGSLGREAGKRSRGELPLLALDARTAAAAVRRVADLDADAWRPFNLVVADRDEAFFLASEGGGPAEVAALAPGVHMFTAAGLDVETSPRVVRNLPRFRDAPAPAPPDWSGWGALLGDSEPPREAAMALEPKGGFGTTCGALLAVGPAIAFCFARGLPGKVPWQPVDCAQPAMADAG